MKDLKSLAQLWLHLEKQWEEAQKQTDALRCQPWLWASRTRTMAGMATRMASWTSQEFLGHSPNNCWGRGGAGGGGMDRIKAHNSRLKLDPRNPVYLLCDAFRRQADTTLDTQAIISGLLCTIYSKNTSFSPSAVILDLLFQCSLSSTACLQITET